MEEPVGKTEAAQRRRRIVMIVIVVDLLIMIGVLAFVLPGFFGKSTPGSASSGASSPAFSGGGKGKTLSGEEGEAAAAASVGARKTVREHIRTGRFNTVAAHVEKMLQAKRWDKAEAALRKARSAAATGVQRRRVERFERLLANGRQKTAREMVKRSVWRELFGSRTAGTPLRLKGHPARVTDLAISADERLLVSCGGDARVWALPEGRLVRVFPPRQGAAIRCARLLPGGRAVVLGDERGYLWIHELKSGLLKMTVAGHAGGPVTALAVGSRGTRLASIGELDRSVSLWRFTPKRRGIERSLFGLHKPLTALAMTPDERHVLAADAHGQVGAWSDTDWRKGQFWRAHKIHVAALAISPGGRRFATTSIGDNEKEVALWDWPSCRLLGRSKVFVTRMRTLAFTGEGRYLLAGRTLLRCADLQEMPFPPELRSLLVPPMVFGRRKGMLAGVAHDAASVVTAVPLVLKDERGGSRHAGSFP